MISQNFSAVGFSNSTLKMMLFSLVPTNFTDTCSSLTEAFLLFVPSLALLVKGLLTSTTTAVKATAIPFTKVFIILFFYFLQIDRLLKSFRRANRAVRCGERIVDVLWQESLSVGRHPCVGS